LGYVRSRTTLPLAVRVTISLLSKASSVAFLQIRTPADFKLRQYRPGGSHPKRACLGSAVFVDQGVRGYRRKWGRAMEYGALAIIAVFLPFFVSLSGSNSVWKFLSFLFCILSVFGALAFFVPGLVCWIIAWIFAGVSFGSRRPTPAATPAIQETQSPARPFRSALGFVLGCAALIGVIVLWSQRNGINAERATFAPSSVTALTINPRETSAPTRPRKPSRTSPRRRSSWHSHHRPPRCYRRGLAPRMSSLPSRARQRR
jgi:hypothetical protein